MREMREMRGEERSSGGVVFTLRSLIERVYYDLFQEMGDTSHTGGSGRGRLWHHFICRTSAGGLYISLLAGVQGPRAVPAYCDAILQRYVLVYIIIFFGKEEAVSLGRIYVERCYILRISCLSFDVGPSAGDLAVPPHCGGN